MAPSTGQRLDDFAEPGCEQAGIDGERLVEQPGVNAEINQGIEPTNGADVTRLGPLDAQVLGLAVDAFACPVRWV